MQEREKCVFFILEFELYFQVTKSYKYGFEGESKKHAGAPCRKGEFPGKNGIFREINNLILPKIKEVAARVNEFFVQEW